MARRRLPGTQLKSAKDHDKAILGNAAAKRTQACKSACKSAEREAGLGARLALIDSDREAARSKLWSTQASLPFPEGKLVRPRARASPPPSTCAKPAVDELTAARAALTAAFAARQKRRRWEVIGGEGGSDGGGDGGSGDGGSGDGGSGEGGGGEVGGRDERDEVLVVTAQVAVAAVAMEAEATEAATTEAAATEAAAVVAAEASMSAAMSAAAMPASATCACALGVGTWCEATGPWGGREGGDVGRKGEGGERGGGSVVCVCVVRRALCVCVCKCASSRARVHVCMCVRKQCMQRMQGGGVGREGEST